MMSKNSTELFNYAIQELRTAVEKNRTKVDIILDKNCPNKAESINRYSNNLKEITEKLREEFKDYKLTTVVKLAHLQSENNLYPLIWTLILQKK